MIWRCREGEPRRYGLNWDYVPWTFGRMGCGFNLVVLMPWFHGPVRLIRIRYATSGKRRLIVDVSRAVGAPGYWVVHL